MPLHEDRAICVRVWDWSETSQTVTLFARALGLVRCVAKGAKRNTTTAFSGGIEMLALGDIAAHIKPGRDLNTLARWDLLETFPAVRRSLECHYAGLYAAELVQRLAADHDPHPGLFDALLTGLRALASPADVPGFLVRFQWAALDEAGYRPVLDRLLPGGEAVPAGARVLQFDPHLGGLSAADPPAESARPEWALRAATVETLRRLRPDPPATAPGAGPDPVDPTAIVRAARFLAAYARYVLGAEPKSLHLVFPDLVAPAPTGPAGGRKAFGR